MTHVTCRLSANNQDQLRNRTLDNRVWATLGMVWYGMVNVDLYSAIITKVSNALDTLVSGEKPGFQTLSLPFIVKVIVPSHTYNTIQYNIRLLEAVRTQRRTMIEREKYVENENVKMVHNE